ncbi:ImmA/IrrE family metallo-endopeptidase [Inquilinus limosus]|nr:ImmA/IrrE family metallo-endopeptidase [Inquilinus limosus]
MIRRLLPGGDQPRLDIVRALEVHLTRLDERFEFSVLETWEMGENHALAHVNELRIEVRSDVYDGAVAGSGRDRMTLAHELGHLVLHADVRLSRRMPGAAVRPFEDPEWQAKCFVGELLIPKSWRALIRNPEEAATYLGVSKDAVITQLNAWQREGT